MYNTAVRITKPLHRWPRVQDFSIALLTVTSLFVMFSLPFVILGLLLMAFGVERIQ